MTDRIEKLQAFLHGNPTDSFVQHALALEYIKAGRNAEARGLFEDILNRDPGYIGSYYHLGKLMESMGEATLALQWYEKGMQAAGQAKDTHACNELQAAYDDLVG